MAEQAAGGPDAGARQQDAVKTSDQQAQTSFQRFVAASQRGLFGLGFILAKDFKPVTIILIVGYMFDLGQLLSFPLSDDDRMPWSKSPGLGTVASSLTFLTRAISADENPAAFLSLLVVAFLWVVSYLGLAYSVAARFSEDGPQSEIALRTLRIMTSLSSGPLYIPTSTVILQGIACQNNSWLNTGLECSGAGHMVIAFILSTGLLGFSGLAIFASLIWVDRSPASLNWGARQHGRYDAAMILTKLILGFCYSVLNHQLVGTVFMAILLMAVGLGQAYLYAFVPVFVQRDINAMYSGGGCALFFASVCLLIAQLLGPEQAYLCVFLGLPAVFGLGFFAARRRLDLIGRGHIRQCQSLADVHVWARRRMQRYAALKHLSERSGVQQGGDSDGAAQASGTDGAASAARIGWSGDAAADADDDMAGDSDGMGAGDDGATANDDTSSVASGNSRPSHAANRSMSTARRRKQPASASRYANGDDSMNSLVRGVSLQVADQLNPEDVKAELKRVKAEAERGYQYGMERFNRDEMAFIQYGIFIRYFSKFSFLECIALSRALKLSPSMDSRFYIFTRIRALRESDGSGLSPVDRVLFDGAFKEVMQMRLHAYRHMARLWNTLSASQPDIADILQTGIAMKSTLEKIDASFRRLMSLNSESTGVLRALAAYLIDLRSQPDRATELLNKANRIEDSSRKQRMKLVQNVEFGATTQAQSILEDGAAIITISGAASIGSTSKLGEIVHVTQSASRLFGYGAQQLLGQNVAVIVPPPIDAVHNRLISGFGRSRTSMVVGSTRLVFGQRKSGEIFPMWLQVSEAPPDERTAEPRFSAVLHEVVTQQDFIVFGGPELQYKVFGCSSRALEMLGIESETLQTEDISMAQFFPSIDSTYNEEIPLNEEDIRAIAAVPVVQDLEDVLGSIRTRQQAAMRRSQAQAEAQRAAAAPDSRDTLGDEGLPSAAGGRAAAADLAGFGGLSGSMDASGAHRGLGGSAVHPGLAPIIGGNRTRDVRALGHSVGFASSPKKAEAGGAGHRDRAGSDESKSSSRRSSTSRKRGEMRTSRHDQLAAAIATCNSALARPLRQQRKPGIIPVRVLGVDKLIVGSCQRVMIREVPTFYVLRYNALHYRIRDDHHSDTVSEAGHRSVSGDPRSAPGSAPGKRRASSSSQASHSMARNQMGMQPSSSPANFPRARSQPLVSRYSSGAWNARTMSKQSAASFTGIEDGLPGHPIIAGMDRDSPSSSVAEGPQPIPRRLAGIPDRDESKSSELPADSLMAVQVHGEPTDGDLAVGVRRTDSMSQSKDDEEGDDDEDDLLGDLDDGEDEEGGATGSKEDLETKEQSRGDADMEQAARDEKDADPVPSDVSVRGTEARERPLNSSDEGDTSPRSLARAGAVVHEDQGKQLKAPEMGKTEPNPSVQPPAKGNLRKQVSMGRGILKSGGKQSRAGSHPPLSRGRSSNAIGNADDRTQLQHQQYMPPALDSGTDLDGNASMHSGTVSFKDGANQVVVIDAAGKSRSFHSGTGSTRSTIARIHQLSQGAVEPEIRSIRIVLLVLAVAVLALGVGIVLYIRNVVSQIGNNSASVWIAGQRRRAMQTGIDAVLWMSFQTFDANGTVTGASSVLDSIEDTVRRLQVDRVATDMELHRLLEGAGGLPVDATASMLEEMLPEQVAPSDLLAGQSEAKPRRKLQYSTSAETALMASNGRGALELLRLISDEMQIAQAKLFELQTDAKVGEFEGDFRTAMRLPQQAGGGTIYVPLIQHVQEIVAAMRRISRLDPQNITVSQRDVLFLSLNSEVWDMAMGHSLEMRYVVFAAVFPRTVQEVVIFGAAVFIVYNLLGSIVFARLSTRLGSKVRNVLQTFLLLPRSTARRLANRSQRQLNKVLREINSELMSDSEEESDDDDADDVNSVNGAGGESSSVQLVQARAAPGRRQDSTTQLLHNKETSSDRSLLAKSLGQADDGRKIVQSGSESNLAVGKAAAAHGSQPAAPGAGKSTRSFGSRRSRNSRWSSRRAREAALVKAMANLREHTDSSQFVLRSTAWLLLPILLVLGFILFFVFWQLSFTQILLRTSQRIIASSSLESQLAGTTNTMLSLNSAIARHTGRDRIIELARRADLQGQKTTAVSAVLTFGGKAVLTKLLVANSTRSDEVFGSISNDEVLLTAIQSDKDPGGPQAYDVMHSDSCTAVVWPNITTDVTLGRIEAAQSRPSESVLTSQEYADALRMCLETEGGVLGEGALSAIATVVFNLRQAVSAVFLDLTGLPPPSMQGNSADDVSVIRRQRRAQQGGHLRAGLGGLDGGSEADDWDPREWHEDGGALPWSGHGGLYGEEQGGGEGGGGGLAVLPPELANLDGVLAGGAAADQSDGRGWRGASPSDASHEKVAGNSEGLWTTRWANPQSGDTPWDWNGERTSSQESIRQQAKRNDAVASRTPGGHTRGGASGDESSLAGATPAASNLAAEAGDLLESRELQTGSNTTDLVAEEGQLSFSTVATMLDFTFKIRAIVNPFLLHSVSAIRINFFLGLNSELSSGQSLVEVSAWVFVGVFLLTTTLYWPAVASLNVPLTSARQMLLLLPEETILRVTVLRTALYRIATEHERNMAGSAKVAPEGGDGAGDGAVASA